MRQAVIEEEAKHKLIKEELTQILIEEKRRKAKEISLQNNCLPSIEDLGF